MSLMDNMTKLYRVDSQLRSLRSRVDSAERNHNRHCTLCQEAEGRHEELKSRKRHLQAHVANLESEAATMDEQLEKFRLDMNSAATTKQYTAVLTELETVKTARGKLDDQMLADMEKTDTVETEITDVAAQVAERIKVRDHAKTVFEERTVDVANRVGELEIERIEAAAAVSAPNLAIFDEISTMYDGEAMSSILEISRKHREYACDTCNMQLPIEQIASLMGNPTQLVRCTACGRILFMPDEIRELLAPK